MKVLCLTLLFYIIRIYLLGGPGGFGAGGFDEGFGAGGFAGAFAAGGGDFFGGGADFVAADFILGFAPCAP